MRAPRQHSPASFPITRGRRLIPIGSRLIPIGSRCAAGSCALLCS